jgi:hypothetical protein
MTKEIKLSFTVYIIIGILLLNTMECMSQTVDSQFVSTLEKLFTSSDLPIEYRPTMRYWWFGGAVTRKQLDREMSDIRDKGFGGVSVFWTGTGPVRKNPVPGVEIVSMSSQEGAQRIAMGVKVAKEKGFTVGFQPPAPFSGKLITEEFRAKDIVVEYELVHADFHDERIIQFTRKERPLFLALIPGKPANWLPPHKDRPDDIAWDPCQTRHALLPQDTRAIILEDMPDRDGKVYLKIPYPHKDCPGHKWLVAAYWTVPFTGTKASGFTRTRVSSAGTDIVDVGPIIDHYSKDALNYFMDSYIEKPAALAGKSVGTIWKSILINSLELHTPRWTPELFSEFEKRRGYDLRPYLHIYLKYAPHRYIGSMNTMEEIEKLPYPARQIVSDVEVTYGELLVENHYETFKEWTHDHGFITKIQGHGYLTPYDWIDAYSHADIPEGEKFGVPEAANTAHITGRPIAAVEIESARGSNIFREQKRLALKYMAQGGNKFEMKNYYSSPLDAKEPWQAGTSIQYFDDWSRFKTLTDFVTRSCISLRSGRHVADVCTFGNRWRWRGSWRTNPALVSLLSKNGYASDRFTKSTLQNYSQVKDGFLLSGSGKYSVMIFNPGKAIPLESLKLVENLIHQGLTVVAVSEPTEVLTFKDHEKQNHALQKLFDKLFPVTINNQACLIGKGKTYRIEKQELPVLLRNILQITPQAEWIGDESISWQHREGKDYNLFFLLNSGYETLEGKILLRAAGRAELWNADTGKIEPVTLETYGSLRTSVRLHLKPDRGYIIVVRSDKDTSKLNER